MIFVVLDREIYNLQIHMHRKSLSPHLSRFSHQNLNLLRTSKEINNCKPTSTHFNRIRSVLVAAS